jgi:type II secretory pathway pseudopilin PulG
MKKQRAWFTIIEILIAIVIFGIGMISLLRAIVYFVASADEAKQKAVGIMLAKEAMDVIYNQRDTNSMRSVRWDCASINILKPEACAYRFESGKTYRVEFNGFTWFTISDPALTSTWSSWNQLYLHTNNGIDLYTHEANDRPSVYTRYVQFSPANFGGSGLDMDHVLKITVNVTYIQWEENRKVILESLLSAWEKDK